MFRWLCCDQPMSKWSAGGKKVSERIAGIKKMAAGVQSLLTSLNSSQNRRHSMALSSPTRDLFSFDPVRHIKKISSKLAEET